MGLAKRKEDFVEDKATTTPKAETKKSSPFIVSARYDLFFFILSPITALILGHFARFEIFATTEIIVNNYHENFTNFFIGTFIMAHLFAVFFRSHGNRSIFKLHPVRFIWVPSMLFIGMVLSNTLLVAVSVLATWWDVYHSSLQTFGFGRLYEMRAKAQVNDFERRLDYVLNLVLYTGPILGGAVLMDHVEDFNSLGDIGFAFFARLPGRVSENYLLIREVVLSFGLSFTAFYLLYHFRRARSGKNYPWPKALLFAVTAIVSLLAWGFNSFGTAFFIMNFFHALQYFAIVWMSENKNVSEILQVENNSFGRFKTMAFMFGASLVYGLIVEVYADGQVILMAASLVVSIMHFWYDGFIWSVKKKQVN